VAFSKIAITQKATKGHRVGFFKTHGGFFKPCYIQTWDVDESLVGAAMKTTNGEYSAVLSSFRA